MGWLGFFSVALSVPWSGSSAGVLWQTFINNSECRSLAWIVFSEVYGFLSFWVAPFHAEVLEFSVHHHWSSEVSACYLCRPRVSEFLVSELLQTIHSRWNVSSLVSGLQSDLSRLGVFFFGSGTIWTIPGLSTVRSVASPRLVSFWVPIHYCRCMAIFKYSRWNVVEVPSTGVRVHVSSFQYLLPLL